MVFFERDYDDDVKRAEVYLKAAENDLQAKKRNRESAKQTINYKNSGKNHRYNGKLGNSYDINVWVAEDLVKQRRTELAEAKKRAAEAKKRAAEAKKEKLAKEREKEKLAKEREKEKLAKEREKEKLAKEREKEKLAKEREEKRKAKKSSESSSHSSSSSCSSSSNYSDANNYDHEYSSNYSNSGSVPTNNEDNLKTSLYNLQNVRKLVQQIDSAQQYEFLQKATGFFEQLNELEDKPQIMVEQLKNRIVGKINKEEITDNARKGFIGETIKLIRKIFNK